VIIIIAVGCIKESSTYYQANIKNKTIHQIKVIPYFSGIVYSSKIILLNAGDSINIARGVDRGKVDHGGFDSDYFSGSDSLHVIFDDTYSISHYFVTPSTFSSKYYFYSSLRNLGNYLSWEYSFKDESKHRREALYLYRFVDQDYLDAK
jgi:hypothetical protein